jgi:hypothetical protein
MKTRRFSKRRQLDQSIFVALVLGLFIFANALTATAQQWVPNGDSLNTTSSVGIGTSGPPADKLDVNGGTIFRGPLRTFDGATERARFSYESGNLVLRDFTKSDAWWISLDQSNTSVRFMGGSLQPANTKFIVEAGNVGIGTSTPDSLLTLYGPNRVLNLQNTDGSPGAGSTLRFGHNEEGSTVPIAEIRSFLTNGSAMRAGDLTFFTTTGGSLSERMRMTGAGNLGIGTPAPQSRLEVVNSGIDSMINIRNTDSRFPGIAFINSNGAMSLQFDATGDHLYAYSASAGKVIVLKNNGNVGIGTNNPSTRLHVVGNVTVDGNIGAKYQDIAEWVSTTRPIPAGSVVILDPNHDNAVLPSEQGYDMRVAGVVSANPGLVLGEAGASKVKVATTGRVKVRVDATVAPIHIGDALVSSNKEGMAMRSNPVEFGGIKMHRPGTLIGKALQSIESGEGEILILLSLQ